MEKGYRSVDLDTDINRVALVDKNTLLFDYSKSIQENKFKWSFFTSFSIQHKQIKKILNGGVAWTWLDRDVFHQSSWPSPEYPDFYSQNRHSMYSSRKRTAKRNNKSTKPSPQAPPSSEIRQLFQLSQLNSPDPKMAAARASMVEAQASSHSPNLQAESGILDSFMDTPPDFHPDTGGSGQPFSLMYRADPELPTG